MQPQPTSNKDYSVFLYSMELEGFFDNTRELNPVITPESLQVSHSIALVVKDKENIDMQIGLKYGEKGKDYSEIRMIHHYKVTNLPEIMHIDESSHEINIDENLLRVIIPVSFSTVRGYFSAKLEGSPLYDYPFPLFKTKDLISSCRILVDKEK